MKNNIKLIYISTFGCLISAVAIVVLANIIIPENSRSSFFWTRVAWTVFLNFILWGSTFSFLFASTSKQNGIVRFGAISPTVSLIAGTYAILSFLAMMIHAFAPTNDINSRIHWIAQILFLTASAVLLAIISVAHFSAESGAIFEKGQTSTPMQLHDLLKIKELSSSHKLSPPLRKSIKQLRENLAYSLHESESLFELMEYQVFSNDIHAFCESLDTLNKANSDNLDKNEQLNNLATTLSNKCGFIASQQIRK